MNLSNENKIINQITNKNDLITQLKRIGINEGMTLEVHSSFKSLGYVVGGARSVVEALLDSLGNTGTLVMSCQCSENSEPVLWTNPPVELALTDAVRDGIPEYNPFLDKVSHMGVIAETLRHFKGTTFSNHPNCGFMANGRLARELMVNQPLDFPLGLGSPLDKMYKNGDAMVLLIGVDFDNCTCMHLAEYLSNVRSIVLNGGAILKNKQRIWQKFLDIELDSDEFIEIGRAMERSKLVKNVKLAQANCKLFSLNKAVDFTVKYLQEKYK